MPEHRYSRCRSGIGVRLSFSSLGLAKAEWLEDIRKGSCSLKSFLGVAGTKGNVRRPQ